MQEPVCLGVCVYLSGSVCVCGGGALLSQYLRHGYEVRMMGSGFVRRVWWSAGIPPGMTVVQATGEL